MNTSHSRQPGFGAGNTGNGSSDRSFGLVFACVFGLIGAWPVMSSGTPRWWAIGIALVLVLVSFTVPGILAWPNRLWTKFGLLLHRIMNPIVLGILFLFVFIPMAAWLRIAGRQPIRRMPGDENTFWQKPERDIVTPDSFRKLY